jgi:DeoR family fructose operon transcriptional repressor
MLASDRQDRILELLERDGSVKTSNLVNIMDVSLETIRRDLDFLEKPSKSLWRSYSQK